ncbi:MAG: malate synthase A [Nitrososphaerales archaeon]|jgi:malate synthase
MESQPLPEGIEILAPPSEEFSAILTPEALRFVKVLHMRFSDMRKMLLQKREERQKQMDSGVLPTFPEGRDVLAAVGWKVAAVPPDLKLRKVEITGPAGDRKMVVNALNSGADVYMADFEDSLSPTWNELIRGQINLRDAVNGSIRFESSEGKTYQLNEKVATLIVRPRGLHLFEEHVRVEGQPVSASLFDFGLFFYHNARALRQKRSGPYFYIPKMESSLEARFWDRLFTVAEEYLVMPPGSVKATALIETLPAAFEMDEILYSLKDHIVGLNCGRWDYIFSYIKKLRSYPQFVLPDRAEVTMDEAFLASYVDLLIKTCHRRGAYAIGGMSAFIPVRGDEEANAVAFQKVRADKEREVRLGHDGTWVAHPGLVPLAREVFDAAVEGPNQLGVLREDVNVSRDDLLRVPEGQITEAGVRNDISVALQYLGSWLSGRGCVPINNLMEDAATAEISRAQLWQWIRHGASLADGRKVTLEMVRSMIAEEASRLSAMGDGLGPSTRIALAARLLGSLVGANVFPDFLTIPAYRELLELEEAEQHSVA